MKTLLWQEGFKLLRKKSTYWVTIVLAGLVFGSALLSRMYPKTFPAQLFFTSSFGATTWVVFVMIAACATSLSMEFQYGTIKELIYQQYSRETILISKWLIMLAYSIYLYAMTGVVALLGKIVLVNDKFSLGDTGTYTYHLTFLEQWLATIGSSFITLWFILSIVFLFATLFRTSTTAVTVGIVMFFTFNIISTLMFKLIDKYHWFKWNPFNFLNYSNQIVDPTRHTLTLLSDNQLFFGSLVYTLFFLCIGLLFFRRRNV
ncbi:ABC transporter permease [Lentilactobacillus hilgardii]|jgi:ABC-2 type transport system permease protein|uniref:ABC transporter permease n=1 Tax=Lentilactobacillus hilgardii TaxID=1588 RepID=UPI0021A63D5F|nr:ABC transporter permease [Lentilactobacillus hilgardii]MCI2019166.1 ABC transporter permease [Lentilactobacillus buchneri]MCP9332435.1 ABC transporter permease [Lentilactobacillus hilgardii]MCP9348925.1 ABC transporter permease [Lentilactobacillus hilgardii]MCP9351849.1 ABC transporter permease [Lentilactobacillus hilgardii]MCT3398473.1 ABC transporter permease [Lentilactobacillus hilgardii]